MQPNLVLSRLATLVTLVALTALPLGCGDDDEGTGPSAEDGAAAEVVFPANCTSQLKAEPASVVVTCADAGVAVANIEWQAWGAEATTGTGTAHVNDCDPDCVAGDISAYEDAEVTLTAIEQCDYGAQYTKLELRFGDEAPKGVQARLRESFPCA